MSESKLIKNLTSFSYADILIQTSQQVNGKAYLFENQNTHRVVVFHNPKKAPGISKEFSPLSFKQITHIAIHFKKDLIANSSKALPVALALENMCANKIASENKRFILIRLLGRICDSISNFFKGYGFQTTKSLALSLCQELKIAAQKVPATKPEVPVPPSLPLPQPPAPPAQPTAGSQPAGPQPKPPQPSPTLPTVPQPQLGPTSIPQPPPQSKPEPKTPPQPLPPPQATTQPKQLPEPPLPPSPTHGKFQKKDVMAAYKNAPWNLEDQRKLMVFKDIKGMVGNSLGIYYGDITTVEHLMKFVSDIPPKERRSIDLNNPKCVQVIVDTLKFCPEQMCDQVVNWLMEQVDRLSKAKGGQTFNLNLLKSSLEVFVSKGNDQQRFSKYALEQLMLIYIDPSLKSTRPAALPLNDATVTGAVELLYNTTPNEKVAAEKFTPWVILQPDYDLNLFVKWIQVFKYKEETISAIHLYYPARDKLLFDFQQRKSWASDIVRIPGSGAVVQYLKAKGVMG